MLFKTNCFARIFAIGAGLLIVGLLSQVVYAHGMSEADKLAIIEGGNLRYMWLGATHMLSGYDHLAFVFGIIFFLSKSAYMVFDMNVHFGSEVALYQELQPVAV